MELAILLDEPAAAGRDSFTISRRGFYGGAGLKGIESGQSANI